MNKATDEDWKQVDETLAHCPLGRAVLMADGYEITIAFCRDAKSRLKFHYIIYVNGVLQGKWILEDCEERRRFFNAQRRSMLSPKTKAWLKKQKKSVQEKYRSECSYISYSPYWDSLKSLRKHLEANNQSIEIKTLDKYL